jgi:hypothetical protein
MFLQDLAQHQRGCLIELRSRADADHSTSVSKRVLQLSHRKYGQIGRTFLFVRLFNGRLGLGVCRSSVARGTAVIMIRQVLDDLANCRKNLISLGSIENAARLLCSSKAQACERDLVVIGRH